MDERQAIIDQLLGLVLVLAVLVWLSLTFSPFAEKPPYSTAINLAYPVGEQPHADPADLLVSSSDVKETVRLGFVGDLMQHRHQQRDNFGYSYMAVKPVLESFDLTFANLEFPVHPKREVGPPANSVKFNGSVEHVKAIADSGIDVCVTSNNHSFDQGLEGIDTTLEVIRQNGLIASGTVPYAAGASQSQLRQPTMLEAKGLRIALYAYTYDLNSYVKEDGKVGWPPRDVPVTILNFKDWTEEYGHYGQEVLCKDVATAANAGSEVTIAFVHWGKEWQLYPTEDMRMAARDMIDCGFGLVVGSHSHVLGGSELYKNKLIVYSLGSLLSAFKPFETRVAAILGVDLQRVGGKAEIVDFWLHPTLIDPKSRIVEIVNADSSGEKLKAWELAKAVFGTSVKSWKINNSTGR